MERGRPGGGRRGSAKARKFAIIALVLGIVVSVIYFFVIVAGGMSLTT